MERCVRLEDEDIKVRVGKVDVYLSLGFRVKVLGAFCGNWPLVSPDHGPI